MHLRIYADFPFSVETAETTIRLVTGCSAFEYFEKNPEEGHSFN
jgi:hypothetical protein